jgi:D-alanyl-D-alanine carboxypeptidase
MNILRTNRPIRNICRALAGAAVSTLLACGGGDAIDSAEHRADIVRSVDAKLDALHRKYPGLPGFVAHVLVKPARLSWGGSTGIADRTTGRKLTPNATFRIASITKTFTAAAIYRLGELGQLSTSDPIERHLSPATLSMLRGAGYDPNRVTIDHLLTHTSGLRDFAISEPYLLAVLVDPARRWSRADQLALAMSLGAPLWQPGHGYEYSDTGYILLGEIIETATGQQLGAAYRSLLRLSTLGLAATYQESIDAVPATAGPRALQDFLPGMDNQLIDASVDLWGGGGLVSDARDLALFMQALLEGKILERSSLQAMLRLALPGTAAPAGAHGIYRFDAAGSTCWGHDAFWGSVALHCPSLGVTVVGSFNASELAQPAGGALAPFELGAELVAAVASIK